ncbi:MAG: cytochrome c3 family protein [Verrucomicrobiota bacterium]
MANIFPSWINRAPLRVAGCVLLVVGAVVAAITYYATPKWTRVGYAPVQPVAFSHDLHVTQLGMDCRYCHTFVDRSEHSNVPGTNTCMSCHSMVATDAPALEPVRNSWANDESIPWVRVHKAPDYVYFNHAVHVNRGISCVECHGEVNEMEVVYHAKSLSMAFCLECHREPEKYIRPVDKVYDLAWKPESEEAQLAMGEELVQHWKVNPPESCSGCHR